MDANLRNHPEFVYGLVANGSWRSSITRQGECR